MEIYIVYDPRFSISLDEPEFEIPLIIDALKRHLTSAMYPNGLYRCPTCNGRILKPGHCYNPHCPDHASRW